MRPTILKHDRTNPERSRKARRRTVLVAGVAVIAVVAAAAVVLVVAGSQPSGSTSSVTQAPPTSTALGPSPTAPPSPTTTPIPTTTPAPTAPPAAPAPEDDPSDPRTWVIGFDGVGPVKLGTSLEEQRQLLPTLEDVTDPLCVPGYLDLVAPSGFTLRIVAGQNQPTTTAAITFGNGSPIADDRASSPTTAEGIGIDSTRADLLATYPDIEKTGQYQSDDYPYYGMTDGSGGWIVFALIDDQVSTIQVANESVLPLENRTVMTIPSERCPA